ncbi:hypothetical protein [Halorubrum laminariae]|uniref:GP-PDE domain-containing protein n=1 Tax=Halorubrum laminariae TaxID=1433523 RepID=A0ABD6C5J8_9EURY|nr:hypothetical protein [Halorubrum laminariae]
MPRVLLDTQFWIQMDRDTESFRRFYSRVSNSDDIEVLFCYGNLMDLVKADHQDNLSVILSETVDTYIPVLPAEGEEYQYSDDPIDVIPQVTSRKLLRQYTSNAPEDATIRAIVATSDWGSPDDDDWKEAVRDWKEVHDEYGFEYMLSIAFDDYLKESEDGETLELDIRDIDIAEYAKKMVIIHRASLLGPNERLSENDFADLEIVSAGIMTSCDLVAIESKWKNVDLFERVNEHLTADPITVVSDFDDLIAELDALLDSE